MRRWRATFFGAVLIALGACAFIVPYLGHSAELVRLRNAWLFDGMVSQDWTPATMPADFARERRAPPPAFAQRVAALNLQSLPSDWQRALAIARHLLERRTGRVGQPIQSDLERTYSAIRANGSGYCGDYADVFSAMALAAGLDVRSWAFSFDGFGGRGHIFNEVWDRAAQRWLMIDAFHNLQMLDDAGAPVSALQFHNALQRDPQALRFVPIEPAARPVFKLEPMARDFYRAGLDQWYLWWGNAVFSYDEAGLVQALGGVSRSLEQVGGIAQGVHPRIRVLASAGNRAAVEKMQRLQIKLWMVAVVTTLALLTAVVAAFGWWRAAQRSRQQHA